MLSIGFSLSLCLFFFFFNDTATTEIYTLSLHDALPIWNSTYAVPGMEGDAIAPMMASVASAIFSSSDSRSEEHTSELQSLAYLVCRLLLEKKKTKTIVHISDCRKVHGHCRSATSSHTHE